jgi:nucleotide-binding universal stress UspA family protein
MHRVDCPVMAVSDKATSATPGPPFRRILCATDLQASSPATIEFALALAGESDAEVELLHVVEAIPLEASSINPSILTAEVDTFRGALIEDAQARLDDAALDAPSWCRLTTRVATGDAWRAIVERARAGSAELVVVGAHVGPCRRAIFGSTARRVVRAAPCPVLVLRAPGPRDVPADGPATAVDRAR